MENPSKTIKQLALDVPSPCLGKPWAQGPAQGPRLGQTWLGMPGHGHGSAKQAWGSDKRWCHGIRRKRKHGGGEGVTFGSLFRLFSYFFAVVPGAFPGGLGIVERYSRKVPGVFRATFFPTLFEVFH